MTSNSVSAAAGGGGGSEYNSFHSNNLCREAMNEYKERKSIEEKKKIEETAKRQQEAYRKIEELEDLNRKIVEERQKIDNITKRQQEVNREMEELETREGKEQHHRDVLREEKILYQLEKINSENRLFSLRNELRMKVHHFIDEVQKSKVKDQRSMPCMICRKARVTVVFVPCAHLLICSNCNEENVYYMLEGRCPSCKTPIEKRIVIKNCH